MKVDRLNETSASRLYNTLTDDDYNCAIISGYVSRADVTEKENLQNLSNLKAEVKERGFGFSQFISRWVDDYGNAFDEQSLLIGKISLEEALELGNKYEQKTIIYKNKNGCFEICSTPHDNHKVGDVVKKFNVKGDKVLNIELAKEIFARRIGGAVSMPIKGDHRPFHLDELEKKDFTLDEVINPRPSYFQEECSYEKII